MVTQAQSPNIYLLVPIALMAALLGTAVIRGPSLVSPAGMGSAIIVAAPLILATYSLMVLAVAGRGTIDLAVGPLLAFINVVVVKLSTSEILVSPIATFIVAVGLGMLYQLAFCSRGHICAGTTDHCVTIWISRSNWHQLGHSATTGRTAPPFMQDWGLGTTIFSPVLLILVLATVGWYLFTATTFYSNLKMTGYDERAAWTSGVKTDVVRVGAHLIAGIYVGLGAICYTALISSGDPTQGQNMTLTAVTALVLGGVALSGGRGGATGALLGAVSLWLIGYVLATFNFGAIQAFITQMIYGLILVASLLLTLVGALIGRYLSFVSPWSVFLLLGFVVVGIMLQVSTIDFYNEAGSMVVKQNLAERYFLVEPARAVGDGLAMTRVQLLALLTLSAMSFTIVARLMNSEAARRRMGLFQYLFIVSLLLALFIVIAIRPERAIVG